MQPVIAKPLIPADPTASNRHARMRSMVGDHSRFVTRALRRAGVPQSDVDDEVQRTFIAATNRIDDVRLGAERSFLFQVALNTASHARRTLARRREFPSERLPELSEPLGTPEDLMVRQQTRRLIGGIVASIDDSLRSVLVLYELEELDTVEIAERLGIPRGTVASRLRRARAQLRRNLAAIELAWEMGVESAGRTADPTPLRREKVSDLARALLTAGATRPAASGTRAKTLAACHARP